MRVLRKGYLICGGLVGINYKSISDSFAVSDCRGGGLCGCNKGHVQNSYALAKTGRLCASEAGSELWSYCGREDTRCTDHWDFEAVWSRNTRHQPVFLEKTWFWEEKFGRRTLPNSSLEQYRGQACDMWEDKSVGSEIKLRSLAELDKLAAAVRDGDTQAQFAVVRLEGDIDCGGRWLKPIGTAQHPFKGVFNGNGHTISGFRIRQKAEGSVGLFGCLLNAVVVNLIVEGKVTGGMNTGILCGMSNLSVIGCCGAEGSCRGYGGTGGLCGSNGGSISRCRFRGYVGRAQGPCLPRPGKGKGPSPARAPWWFQY